MRIPRPGGGFCNTKKLWSDALENAWRLRVKRW